MDDKLKLDPRATRSRDALGRTLLELIAEKPLDQITIRELTGKAGVGYATFFRHFEALDEVLVDAASADVEKFIDLAVPMLVGDHRLEAAESLCAYVDSRRTIWTALLTRGGGTTLRQKLLERTHEAIAREKAERSDIPLSIQAFFGVRGTVDIIAFWLLRGGTYTGDQIVGFLRKMVIDVV